MDTFTMTDDNVIAYYIAEGVTGSSQPKILKETKESITFEAILQDTHRNRNNRVYSGPVLNRALAAPNLAEQFNDGGVLCEANHPMDAEPGKAGMSRLSEVDLTRVSHIVRKASMVNESIKGLLETAITGCGRDLKGLISQGFRPSFSMRGFGSVESGGSASGKGSAILIERCKIICWDWVGTPSHKNAKMTGIVEAVMPVTQQETTDFLLENSRHFNLLQDFLPSDTIEAIQLTEGSRFATIKTKDQSTKVLIESVVRKQFFDMF